MEDNITRKSFSQGDGVALHEHLSCRISEQRAYFEAKLSAMERATVVATERLAERLDGMNEFRDALKDQAGRMVTRDEMEVQFEKVDEQLDSLKRSRDLLDGKASQKSVDIALLFSGVGMLIAIIGLILHILTM